MLPVGRILLLSVRGILLTSIAGVLLLSVRGILLVFPAGILVLVVVLIMAVLVSTVRAVVLLALGILVSRLIHDTNLLSNLFAREISFAFSSMISWSSVYYSKRTKEFFIYGIFLKKT